MQFVEKYTITLHPNKLAYYKKHKNNAVFKDIHVAFELEEEDGVGKLNQVSGGNPLDKYNKVDINKVIGVDGYLDQLHKAGIYHGDIITGVFNNEKEEYDDLKINVGNILKDKEGEIKLIDFGPINEEEKRSDKELMRIEKEMLEQVRKKGRKKTHSPRRRRPGDLNASERKARNKKMMKYDELSMPGYDSDSDSDSDISIQSPPKRMKPNQSSGSNGFAVRGNLFYGGKKKRRRTKKKRKRKRKTTKKKRKRKRKRTKKKRKRRR
jgi:hypothetical protein